MVPSQKPRPWRTLVLLVAATACFALGTISLHGNATGSPQPTQPGQVSRRRLATELQLGVTTTPAGVHGVVQKRGPLDIYNWHYNHTVERWLEYAVWLRQQGVADVDRTEVVEGDGSGSSSTPGEDSNSGTAGITEAGSDSEGNARSDKNSNSTGAPAPPPIFPACHIFINHLYRFIYLRHAKVASTSLIRHFGYCDASRTSYNSSCLDRLDVGPSQRLPLDQVQRIWSDYFVFSFVRNPWNRAVSSYLMMMRSLEWEPMPKSTTASGGRGDGGDSSSNSGGFVGGTEGSSSSGGSAGAAAGSTAGSLAADTAVAQQRHRYKLPAARQYRWDNFCADPGSFQRVCEKDRRCRRQSNKFVGAHIQAQLPCLATAQGGWAVDFLGRVESIDEDLNEVIAILDSRRVAGAPPLGTLPQRLGNANGRPCQERNAATFLQPTAPENYCDREQYFHGPHASCVASLAKYYSGDVGALQFSVVGDTSVTAGSR
ncbi:hypothetical protein N2152v2_006849 [Parachlorella kessleri]